jgi:hypothetical protein
MLAAADVGQSVVASILALGTAGLAGAIVAMVWWLQWAQVQRGGRVDGREAAGLAGEVGLAGDALPPSGISASGIPAPRASMPLTDRPAPAMTASGRPAPTGNGNGAPRSPAGVTGTTDQAAAQAAAHGAAQAAEVHHPGLVAPSAIEGPDSVVIGEQARYRVRHSAAQQVVAWAAGGGAVSQASDPAHPDDLLLVAARPGNLTVSVRLREGLAERREIKSVTAVANPETTVPAAVSRLLLQDWPIVTVAVLVAGFAATLVALGSLGVSDFIALVAPLTAVLAVVAATRGSTGRPGR